MQFAFVLFYLGLVVRASNQYSEGLVFKCLQSVCFWSHSLGISLIMTCTCMCLQAHNIPLSFCICQWVHHLSRECVDNTAESGRTVPHTGGEFCSTGRMEVATDNSALHMYDESLHTTNMYLIKQRQLDLELENLPTILKPGIQLQLELLMEPKFCV